MRWVRSVKKRMLLGEVEPRSSTQSGVSLSQTRARAARPLERRVSFCGSCGVAASVPPDEPRKSFMKFCVTDAITLTRGHHQRELLSGSLFRLALNVELALKVCALFDGNPLRSDLASHRGRLAQLDAIAGLQVAL